MYHIPEGTIVVPSFTGLSASCSIHSNNIISSETHLPMHTDAQVHSLEYGFHRLLPLDDGDSTPGASNLSSNLIL